jgi:carbonic anhydrase
MSSPEASAVEPVPVAEASEGSGMSVTLVPAGSSVEAAPGSEAEAPALEASPAKAHVSSAPIISAEQSISWLKNGNKRFVKARLRADGQGRKDVVRLTSGQQPHAIILSCSDSRVPPEIVFDQKLGEIFVIRTAGEALDDNVIGSIEYAVAKMHTRLLLVMGHTQCGAVNAALRTLNGEDAGSPALNHLVAGLQPYVKPLTTQGPSSQYGAAESFAVARGIAAEIVERSQILKAAVDNGELSIRSALYHLDSGTVEF